MEEFVINAVVAMLTLFCSMALVLFLSQKRIWTDRESEVDEIPEADRRLHAEIDKAMGYHYPKEN